VDKIKILEILNDYNYWNRSFKDNHSRPQYESKIESLSKINEVVVVKGLRRSGKSTLLLNHIKNLCNDIDIKNILFINLEDPRFIGHLNTELLEQIKETYLQYINPSQKPYIFLDEIQNIPNFEKWINKEYELNLSHLFITGSNSSMLSSEIASTLSGRYVSTTIYPLSFKEFLSFKKSSINTMLDFIDKKIAVFRYFDEYLKYGAFPKVVQVDAQNKQELLISYKDSILLKDIVARYKLNNYNILEQITAFLLSNSGILQSATKIKNNFNISFDMASSYVEYLKNTYMIYEVPKFDYSLKKQNLNEKKYYSCDLGLSNIYRVPNLQTKGSDIETIVFLELLRRGFKVYYYKTANNYECDFIVQKDNQIVQLIQVTLTLKDEKTKKRELSIFRKVKDELNLDNIEQIVITTDESDTILYKNEAIKIINIFEWLLF
jgi:predicted AAA+ superfamily ATPase